jgi:hypothetical protein
MGERKISRRIGLVALAWASSLPLPSKSAEPDANALIQQVVTAAGGDDKLLKLFRIREQLNVSSDPEKKGNERVSVLAPPKQWWVGKKERVK